MNNICLVCLRVDKRTKVNTALAEFHKGLCSFQLCGVSEINYCTECEYLLMKFYKFKQKCVKALEIFQLWNKYNKKEKKSINSLYKFLPPPSIDVWRPNPKRIGNVFIKISETVEDDDVQIIEERNIKEEKGNTKINTEINPEPKRNGNVASKSAGNKDISRKDIKIVDTITDDIEIEDSESEEDFPNETTEKDKSVEHRHRDIKKENIKIAYKIATDIVETVNSDKGITVETVNSDKGITEATEKEKLNCYSTLQQLLSNAYIDKSAKKQVKNNEDIFDDDCDIENLKNNENNKKQEIVVMINKKEDVLKKMKEMKKFRIKKDKRLAIEELTSQLSEYGELSTPTGLVIEKKLLLMLATHEAGDVVLDKLKNTTCREDVLILSKEIEFALDTINSDLVKKEEEYRTVFNIEFLNTREQKMAEFERRKSYVCYVNTEYKCETCYRPFKNAAHVEYHMKKVHVERPGRVCCSICKVWHTERSTHSTVFMCKLCPLVTYSRKIMIDHYEWHKGTVYPCKVCGHVLKSKSAHALHMGKHGGNFCGGCGRGFQNQYGLEIHKKESTKCNGIHSPASGAARCDSCDVTFPSEKAYSCHMKSVHKKQILMKRSGKGTISCPVCKVVLRTGYFGLVQHFKKEHPAENLQQYYVHKKKFLCDICGRAFSTNAGVKMHRRIHTGERTYPCDLCPKTFRTRSLLAGHRGRHYPPALPCNICGKLFKTDANLTAHTVIHTNERKHKCYLCGKAFKLATALKEHIQGVHHNIKRAKMRQTDVERRNKVSVIEINDINIVNETKQATDNLVETQARESGVSETTENCDELETNNYDIPETIEECDVSETVESNELLETIDNYEDAETLENDEASETLESYEASETLESNEASETLENCDVSETTENCEELETNNYDIPETIEECEVSETVESNELLETIDDYEDAETLESYEASETLEDCDVSETIESWDAGVCEDDTETMEVDDEYETEVLEDWDEYDTELITE